MRLHCACRIGLPGLAALVALNLPTAAAADPTPEGIEFFEKKIRPVLVDTCFRCHGTGKKLKGGLRLTSRNGLLTGGDTGPAIIPGQPAKSLLVKAIGYKDPDLRMPPKSKMADDQIAHFIKWIEMGAPWPKDESKAAASGVKPFDLKERAKHWAFQPLRKVVPPAVKTKDWARSPIDTFVLAGLEAHGLTPAPPANKRTLLRRVTFDLIGLPPTPAEIDAFLADDSPRAFAKVVDRLLASPHYGERWGRHWLDLVRFAETAGHEFDFELPDAYAYRDYIIRAFNSDLPYDQFVVEHIAGDLLTTPRRHPAERWNESIIGTGFWFLGESKHSPVDIRGDAADRTDNQIDVLTKTFLGLTVSCARCHDHKFDAISTRDYYALAGYLRSSRFQRAYIDAPERTKETIDRLRDLQARARKTAIVVTARTRKEQAEQLAAYLLAARRTERSKVLAKVPHLDGDSLARFRKAYNKAGSRNPVAPLFVWRELADPPANTSDRPFTARRRDLLKRLRSQARTAAQNNTRPIFFADFKDTAYKDWFVTGDAFGTGPSRSGDVVLGADRRSPVRRVLPAGLAHSGLVSGRLQGLLRSKTFTIGKKQIWYRLGGSGGQVNLIIDGFQQIRDPIYGGLTFGVRSGDRMEWHVQDVSMWIGHRAYIEIIDQGAGHVAVEQVLFANDWQPAAGPNSLLVRMMDDARLTSAEALAGKYQKLFLDLLDQWQAGKLAAQEDAGDRIALLNWLLESAAFAALPSPRADRPTGDGSKVVDLLARCRQLEDGLDEPKKAMAMADGTGENEHVFIRGSHKNLGPEVPRRFLEAIGGGKQPAPAVGSGRLALARRLVDPGNPLPPRVLVNRLWQHHFGEGIVRSPDNFGVLGERPTHPELLDFLAGEFVRRGWSIKKMHRLLLLSSTYQMASRTNAHADRIDPQNKGWHRMPVRRLEAEAIRDAILAVAGRLDQKLYGPSVAPYLTPFMIGRGRPDHSGPLDGAGRRSIYLGVRRNFLTPMFLAFDYPIPFTTMGKRSVSNVPAQALTLMNNPFVVQQAERWAGRVLAEPGRTDKERIMRMYVMAFGRPPLATELDEALTFLVEQGKEYGRADDPRAWADLCHVLLNVKEFIFIN
jgi:hypothetical protein